MYYFLQIIYPWKLRTVVLQCNKTPEIKIIILDIEDKKTMV